MKISRKHDTWDSEDKVMRPAINISGRVANLGIQDYLRGWGDGSVGEYLPMLRQCHKKRVGYKDKVNVKRLAHLHLLS